MGSDEYRLLVSMYNPDMTTQSLYSHDYNLH
jgi:hypothetical protein